MPAKSKAVTEKPATSVEVNGKPRSLAIAESGVKTSADFARMMSAIMSDVIVGRISPAVGNAACNAGGKLLKMVEMQHRYGRPASGSAREPRVITLAGAEDDQPQIGV